MRQLPTADRACEITLRAETSFDANVKTSPFESRRLSVTESSARSRLYLWEASMCIECTRIESMLEIARRFLRNLNDPGVAAAVKADIAEQEALLEKSRATHALSSPIWLP